MRFLYLPFVGLFCLIVASNQAYAKDWKGIIPVRSTKSDVVKMLGEPSKDDESSATFISSDGKAVVYFSKRTSRNICERSLPENTVTHIILFPFNELRLSDLQYDTNDFRKTVSDNITHYVDNYSGLWIKTQDEKVIEMKFKAAEKDSPACIEIPIDDVGLCGNSLTEDLGYDLLVGDSKQGADMIYVLTLNNDKNIFIIIYPSERTNYFDDMKYGLRLKQYLVNDRKMNSDRILITVGDKHKSKRIDAIVWAKVMSPPLLLQSDVVPNQSRVQKRKVNKQATKRN